MLTKLGNMVIFMALFALIIMQTDPNGRMLASDYTGLSIALVICLVSAVINSWLFICHACHKER